MRNPVAMTLMYYAGIRAGNSKRVDLRRVTACESNSFNQTLVSSRYCLSFIDGQPWRMGRRVGIR